MKRGTDPIDSLEEKLGRLGLSRERLGTQHGKVQLLGSQSWPKQEVGGGTSDLLTTSDSHKTIPVMDSAFFEDADESEEATSLPSKFSRSALPLPSPFLSSIPDEPSNPQLTSKANKRPVTEITASPRHSVSLLKLLKPSDFSIPTEVGVGKNIHQQETQPKQRHTFTKRPPTYPQNEEQQATLRPSNIHQMLDFDIRDEVTREEAEQTFEHDLTKGSYVGATMRHHFGGGDASVSDQPLPSLTSSSITSGSKSSDYSGSDSVSNYTRVQEQRSYSKQAAWSLPSSSSAGSTSRKVPGGSQTSSNHNSPSRAETDSTMVPKSLLAEWFAGKYRVQISREQYVSWNDGALSHIMMFTSIFVDPVGGEAFLSGRYGDGSNFQVRSPGEIVWYSTKKNAEHGAASRAYDCFQFRQCFYEKDNAKRHERCGLETPYLERASVGKIPWQLVPPAIQEQVKKLQEKTRLPRKG